MTNSQGRGLLVVIAAVAVVLGAWITLWRGPGDGGSGGGQPVVDAPGTEGSREGERGEPRFGAPERDSLEGGALVGSDRSAAVVARVLGSLVVARAEPSLDAAPVAEFTNPLPTGGPLVFQVIGSAAVGDSGDGWLEVLLPVRPNGTAGWVRGDEVELSRNRYRILVDVAGRELEVQRSGEPVLTAVVAVGTESTPTPQGSFYVTELLRPPDPEGPYGSYAFGLSGFSDVLDSYAGGDGTLGIHGTNDALSLGHGASHGCVRVDNDIIEQMAEFLPLGTPVIIT